MSVYHVLRGYDRQSDHLAIQYDVPKDVLQDVVRHVSLEEGDTDVFGVYRLDQDSALAIAQLIGRDAQVAKDLAENDFFLEAEADIDTVTQQIEEISAR